MHKVCPCVNFVDASILSIVVSLAALVHLFMYVHCFSFALLFAVHELHGLNANPIDSRSDQNFDTTVLRFQAFHMLNVSVNAKKSQ